MVVARKGIAVPASPVFTSAQLETGITRLERRLAEVEAFDPASVTDQFHHPGLDALKVSIADALSRTFGENTSEYRRYQSAAFFDTGPIIMGERASPREIISEVSESKERSIAILRQAIASLKERLEEMEHDTSSKTRASGAGAPLAKQTLTRRVFVVHGHDEGARETVARYLEKLGFDPIILHEQANQGRTVIEKIEAHGKVDFAVVLLTPDDQGCKIGEEPKPRARQNVLLELGYFMGRLNRANVCALKRGEIDIPSDFAGVVWHTMDDGGAWKQSLARELQAAGHEIDWNILMRA